MFQLKTQNGSILNQAQFRSSTASNGTSTHASPTLSCESKPAGERFPAGSIIFFCGEGSLVVPRRARVQRAPPFLITIRLALRAALRGDRG